MYYTFIISPSNESVNSRRTTILLRFSRFYHFRKVFIENYSEVGRII